MHHQSHFFWRVTGSGPDEDDGWRAAISAVGVGTSAGGLDVFRRLLVVILLHAGLLFAPRVRLLWELTASLGDRPSHSISEKPLNRQHLPSRNR
jgi:hypothetical protein